MIKPISKKKLEAASRILKAVSHPDRLAIVNGLMQNECNVGEIQTRLSLPQSTVSQHLRILRDAGIIRGRQDKNRRCYRVVNDLARAMVLHIRKD